MFKQEYICEHCTSKFIWSKDQIPSICPNCNDTGYILENIYIYNCHNCINFKNNDGLGDICNLIDNFYIEDIECPGFEKLELILENY